MISQDVQLLVRQYFGRLSKDINTYNLFLTLIGQSFNYHQLSELLNYILDYQLLTTDFHCELTFTLINRINTLTSNQNNLLDTLFLSTSHPVQAMTKRQINQAAIYIFCACQKEAPNVSVFLKTAFQILQNLLIQENSAPVNYYLGQVHRLSQQPEEQKLAFEYFEKAALLNFPIADFYLGEYYKEGIPNFKSANIIYAFYHYLRAAQAEYEPAKQTINDISKLIAPNFPTASLNSSSHTHPNHLITFSNSSISPSFSQPGSINDLFPPLYAMSTDSLTAPVSTYHFVNNQLSSLSNDSSTSSTSLASNQSSSLSNKKELENSKLLQEIKCLKIELEKKTAELEKIKQTIFPRKNLKADILALEKENRELKKEVQRLSDVVLELKKRIEASCQLPSIHNLIPNIRNNR